MGFVGSLIPRTLQDAWCVGRRGIDEAAGEHVGHVLRKSHITVRALAFPLADVTGYGVRVTGVLAPGTYRGYDKPLNYYEDTLGFADGPAEVVLRAIGVAHPFPAAYESQLLGLLCAGAKLHRLWRQLARGRCAPPRTSP
jgi:hypothetical protein